jgi:hypothetical protein
MTQEDQGYLSRPTTACDLAKVYFTRQGSFLLSPIQDLGIKIKRFTFAAVELCLSLTLTVRSKRAFPCL